MIGSYIAGVAELGPRLSSCSSMSAASLAGSASLSIVGQHAACESRTKHRGIFWFGLCTHPSCAVELLAMCSSGGSAALLTTSGTTSCANGGASGSAGLMAATLWFSLATAAPNPPGASVCAAIGASGVGGGKCTTVAVPAKVATAGGSGGTATGIVDIGGAGVAAGGAEVTAPPTTTAASSFAGAWVSIAFSASRYSSSTVQL